MGDRDVCKGCISFVPPLPDRGGCGQGPIPDSREDSADPFCEKSPMGSEEIVWNLWSEGGSVLRYARLDGFSFVYLWVDGIPVATRYLHDVCRFLGVTPPGLVSALNGGTLDDRLSELAHDMEEHSEDYLGTVAYFMKRLSISRNDARILAIHFTGMGPDAITLRFGMSRKAVRQAFDRIISAYTDSGIVVDDTVFTYNPFLYY